MSLKRAVTVRISCKNTSQREKQDFLIPSKLRPKIKFHYLEHC